MAEKFLMPKLSPTMEEGQIARWTKNEGDAYEAGETLAEVDTDKATMEMTALTGGTLLKILKAGGETARLGETIAITGQKGEDISALLAEVGSGAADASKAGSEKPAPAPAEKEPSASAPTVASATVERAAPAANANGGSNGRLIVSPIAARMAAENGLDLKTVT
ncbi:MAG TPA: biotin/lipoyl-containing protein, partial [Pyrinomonadaceae bacterium]|nr:biotin/lipoyl-containing protein [Pyrinomonadaceae bacterium]